MTLISHKEDNKKCVRDIAKLDSNSSAFSKSAPYLFSRLIGGMFVAIIVASCGNSEKPTSSVTTKTTSTSASTASTATAMSKWEYTSETDPMNGKINKYTSIIANEKLHFEFPYQGGSIATITIRKRAKDGLKILLQVSKGQFTCNISGCYVRVRFDDKPAYTVSAGMPADYSTDSLFLSQASKLVANMKTAKVMRIEAQFFQQGTRVMTFDVHGLEWESPPTRK